MPHDESQEDAFAAEIAAEVNASYPNADEAFRRSVARLWIRQRLGIEAAPGAITQEALGRALGEDRRRVSEIEARALAKSFIRLRQLHPELF